MGNSILVLHPLIRHPKRMLQLLARTISIQDSNFKSWMLRSDNCLVWLFYINRFFLSGFSLFYFFHGRALTPRITTNIHRYNVPNHQQGLNRHECSVLAHSPHNTSYLPDSSSSFPFVCFPGSFLSRGSK